MNEKIYFIATRKISQKNNEFWLKLNLVVNHIIK